MVDRAMLDAGLARYLGTAGPRCVLDYVTLGAVAVAVVTVLPGDSPLLARASYSATKPIVQDGRIYIRRSGATEQATLLASKKPGSGPGGSTR